MLKIQINIGKTYKKNLIYWLLQYIIELTKYS